MSTDRAAERAAEVLREQLALGFDHTRYAHRIAQSLADAGLLADQTDHPDTLGALNRATERAERAEAWLDELGAAAGYGPVADVAAHQRALGVEGDHETRLHGQRVQTLKNLLLEETEWRRQVLHEWQERAEAAEGRVAAAYEHAAHQAGVTSFATAKAWKRQIQLLKEGSDE